MRRGRTFVTGFVSGIVSAALAALALLYLAARTSLTPHLVVPEWFGWLDHNLGLSVPVFVVLFYLYLMTLGELGRRVRERETADRIAQMDHLTDTWTSLFFGVGVIWTAIGMRNALLYALGDPVATVDAGAMAMLERMVDGGILVALTTTIVGGAGGYLMRVAKTVTIGAQLRRSYAEHGRADALAIRSSLETMNERLAVARGVGQE